MSDENINEIMKRANMGDAQAQFDLANILYNKENGSDNKLAIAKWYEAAALQGNPDHQMGFGLYLCWDTDVKSDFAEGIKWIVKAADQSNIGAQYFLGAEFATGENVPQDLEKALSWYKKAEENGHPEAMYNLAVMYWLGEGVQKDSESAKKLLMRSALLGEINAIRTLADAYLHGRYGYSVDKDKAEYWESKYSSIK